MCLSKDLGLSEDIQALLKAEYERAVRKHGPTFDSIQDAMEAMIDEFDEVLAAYRKDDIHGKHGIRNEVLQCIVVFLKTLKGIPEVKA